MKSKYQIGDQLQDLYVYAYKGHTTINPRNLRVMSKEQHWYDTICKCGFESPRSQQELLDPRYANRCRPCNIRHNKLNPNQLELKV